MDDDEAEERRCGEIQFVESAYTPDEAWCEKRSHHGETLVHRILSLSRECNDENSSVQMQLSLTMSSGYPVESPLGVSATALEARHGKGTSTAAIIKEAWNALPDLVEACRDEAKSSIGEEAVWKVFSRADEWIQENWHSRFSSETQLDKDSLPDSQRPANDKPALVVLGRRLVYSHHIVANSKRTAIRELTSHYQLTGYVKIGWPGIILIEGLEQDCIDFYDEIRPMSWQYLVVRGEQQEDVLNEEDFNMKRKFTSFQEINHMSELAQRCREVGLESLFKTSMKNYKETQEEGSRDTHGGHCDDNSQFRRYGALVHVDHMNNGKSYRKWLRKTSREVHCFLLIKQFFPNDDFSRRPIILVGILGDSKSLIAQFMKRWRSSRVDVDAKRIPCLERKMSILAEGLNNHTQNGWDDEFQTEEHLNTSHKQLKDLLLTIGGQEWTSALEDVTKV